MANYIYGIADPKLKECYIGQSSAQTGNPYKRFQDHILKAYGYSTAKQDDSQLTRLIQRRNLQDLELYIFTDSDNYGLTPQQYQIFCNFFQAPGDDHAVRTKTSVSQNSLTSKIKQLNITGYEQLDIAEILHIANAQKQKGTVLNKDMGGQTTYWLLRGTDIRAFNKNDSPQMVLNVLESSSHLLSDLQNIINQEAKKLFIDKEYGGQDFISTHFNEIDMSEKKYKVLYPLIQKGISQDKVIDKFTNAIKRNPAYSTLPLANLKIRFHMKAGSTSIAEDITKMFIYRFKDLKLKGNNILTELTKETQKFADNTQYTIPLKDILKIQIVGLNENMSSLPQREWGGHINMNKQSNIFGQEIAKQTAYTIFRRAVKEVKDPNIYNQEFQNQQAFHSDENLQIILIHKDTTLSAKVHEGYINKGISNSIVLNSGRKFYSGWIQYTINQDDPGQVAYDAEYDEPIYYREKQKVNGLYVGHKGNKIHKDGTSNEGDNLIY